MNHVNIIGGLGNQLFQYAFARYLEVFTASPVKLYTGFFQLDTTDTAITPRTFSLDKFNTKYAITNEPLQIDNVIDDNSFDPEISYENVFFNGYWQDIKFFSFVHDLIISELSLKQEYITEEIHKLAIEMNSCNSVAIHIRRQDYLNNFNKDIFYNVSLEYYSLAVNHISKVLGADPVLYIFSDDYKYIESNMSNFCNCRTILMKPRKDYEDLYLMTQAKHHIISNSTFGWWGATLSEHTKGITIAPKHWYKDRKNPPLYCDNWIKMDNKISNDKISVIIPAYNVEKYIDRCLSSIEQQTYDIKDLEIILINDASTDNTLNHLESFEKKYPNNVVLIKLSENSGLSAARNIGLDHSSGKYVTFIDSDDLIDISMLYKMYNKIKEYDCDVVECGYKKFSCDNEIFASKDLDESFYLDLKDTDSRRKLIMLTCSKTSVWGRLYKKDFIDKNRLRFIEHLYFEDIPFSGLIMFNASSYYRINETLYFYYTNTDGIVFSSYKKERVHQEINAVEKFLSELYEKNMLERIITEYKNELSIYCMTKAFVDPLTLLLSSNLQIPELMSEVNYFKEKLLNLFPDAASCYNLNDEYGICSLALYLLSVSDTMTEKLFQTVSSSDIVLIKLSEGDETGSQITDIIKEFFPDITRHDHISISLSQYVKEHLLIRHALNVNNTIFIIIDGFISPKDQYEKTSHICTILQEYPDNRIVLVLSTLYYNESDECLGYFSQLVDCLNSHCRVSIVIRDPNAYSLGCSLLPSVDIRLI